MSKDSVPRTSPSATTEPLHPLIAELRKVVASRAGHDRRAAECIAKALRSLEGREYV